MTCVSLVSFSFLLNGEQFGFLRPERGLRQGDLLSPYLFLLCAEAFSGMIRKPEEVGSIRGIAVSCSTPPISHLLFADDTLIFSEASTEALMCIRTLLSLFENASGLKINLLKSAMVISHNVEMERRQELEQIMGVTVVMTSILAYRLVRDGRRRNFSRELKIVFGASYIIGRLRNSHKRGGQFSCERCCK
ncbi:UNVERIFIED_CONTAM: putative mitochondrial protein [Sesamum latifolium]|uniref:Mitochondrial protein n=1 Tax=Sesamum latifolium TaxID=2727402 RepID=A0AAW2X3N0_9LAMI